MKSIVIAIDGPAGAGKSTVSKTVARTLGYMLVDTGAIYRSVAWLAIGQRVALDNDAALSRIVSNLDIRFRWDGETNRVFVSGKDVSESIRTPEISMAASNVSARKVVRDGLLELQRKLAGSGGAVLEGRDIGTVVFPGAEVKIFLDASPEERARRRHRELSEKGPAPSFERVLEDVTKRDAQDAGRDLAPLKPAPDAIILDSTKLSIDQVVSAVIDAARVAGAIRDYTPPA